MNERIKEFAEQAGWDMGDEVCGFTTRLEKFAELVRAPRHWVGLTDEEIMEVVSQITSYRGEYMVCVGKAIEAKLKEKNNVLR